LAFQLLAATSAYLLPSHLHVCTPARQHPLRTAPLRMNSEWSASDEASLRNAIERASTTRLGSPHSVLQGLDSAYVLIFNAGQQDEGVYTLQGRAAQANAYVLAFELNDDAGRFAQLLQAEGFDLATPLKWEVDTLAKFCSAGSFEVSLVPKGTLITPPAKNEYDKDAFERLQTPAADEPYDTLDVQGRRDLAGGYAPSDEGKSIDTSTFASEREKFERLFKIGE